MKLKTNETALVRSCLAQLKARGILAWRQNAGAVRASYKGKERFVRFNTMPGVSDILGVMPPSGRLLACEAKVGRNVLSADQEAFLRAVERSGGLAVVVRSIDDLLVALKREGL